MLPQSNYPDKPGLWEYRGECCISNFDLYIAILGYELAEQFGITDVLGLIAVLSGAPLLPTRGKFRGATKGTSIASIYIKGIANEVICYITDGYRISKNSRSTWG